MKLQRILIISLFLIFVSTSMYGQRKKRVTRPFYKTENFININAGLYYFYPGDIRPISPPLYINPEITIGPVENLTAGLVFLHYAYNKDVQYRNDDMDYYSLWTDDPARFHHFFIGLKGAYHLNDIINDNLPITVDPAKWDIYGSLLTGYNFVSVSSDNPNLSASAEAKKLRMGLTLGARAYPMPNISVYTELGYTPYGIGTVGISYMLGEKF